MLYGLVDLGRIIAKEYPGLTKREKLIVRECYNVLTDQDSSDETFEIFWDKFHTKVNLPRTDKARALKAWKKLTKTAKYKATMRIGLYAKQRPSHEHNYLRKACYYLSDELYNDELVPVGNTDDISVGDKYYKILEADKEWMSQAMGFYKAEESEILNMIQAFITKLWLSGSLPTDFTKFKILFIQYLDKKNYGNKTSKGQKRINSYKSLISGLEG